MPTLTKYRNTINRAVVALNGLRKGQLVDLLLDNHPEIRNCTEAQAIVDNLYHKTSKG